MHAPAHLALFYFFSNPQHFSLPEMNSFFLRVLVYLLDVFNSISQTYKRNRESTPRAKLLNWFCKVPWGREGPC